MFANQLTQRTVSGAQKTTASRQATPVAAAAPAPEAAAVAAMAVAAAATASAAAEAAEAKAKETRQQRNVANGKCRQNFPISVERSTRAGQNEREMEGERERADKSERRRQTIASQQQLTS